MQIKWHELGQVALVSAAFAVGIAVVFTLGVLGLSSVQGRRHSSRGPAVAGAGIAFALCAAAAGYGLYLLIPQFH